MNDGHLYLDLEALRSRGWTESMVARFLGAPDRWGPAGHWANFTGKRLYFLERVEQVEASDDFEVAFRQSPSRRKIGEEQRALFFSERERTRGQVQAWLSALTDEDRRNLTILGEAAKHLEAARAGGLRTPHKAQPGAAAERPGD